MSGPTSTAGSRPEPSRSSRGPRLEALEQRLDDGPLDDDPRGGRAALAGRPEGRPQDPVGGEVEVGVGEDDDAVLAAELERDALEPAPGALRDALAGHGRAGERDDRRRPGCRRSRRRPRRPSPVTRLTTPGGKPASAISSTRSVAQCGVSDDGLNTTVLPVTSAGIVFQHGMAIGKFQGVMIPATPSGWRMLIAHLSGSSDGHRVAGHPAALAGHQVGDVDAFLDVAARLGEDLAHLAGHRPREPFLVLGHERPERVQDLAALGGRGATPHREGGLGRLDGHRDVGLRPLLEPPDDVAGVGRVAALEGLAGGGLAPLPGDEVAEGGGLDGGLGHGGECTPQSAPGPPSGRGASGSASQPMARICVPSGDQT